MSTRMRSSLKMNPNIAMSSQYYSVEKCNPFPPHPYKCRIARITSNARRFFSPRLPSVTKLNKFRRNLIVARVSEKRTFSDKAIAKVLAVVEDGSLSPIKNTPWFHVMSHIRTRLAWIDEGYDMLVYTDADIVQSLKVSSEEENTMKSTLCKTDIMVVINLRNDDTSNLVLKNSQMVPTVVWFDCSSHYQNKLGGSLVSVSDSNIIERLYVSRKRKESLEILRTVYEAWSRYNSEDIRYALLVLINAYVSPVPMLKNLRATGLPAIKCMVKNCGPQILKCLLDPNCRKALACLNKCSATDQVCSYRCIASYESPELEAFSLCVLQKHNCLGLDAAIPKQPDVQPLSFFRDAALTHELAEDIFVGWLGELRFSWRVVAGQNPAYDQFPCQYQLFYRGKAKGSFWYEPVFQVQNLEGNLVWRRRRYRVQRGTIPGTFYFTVSDNGVVSREYWRIVDACDDLSWGIFFYSGAARAAGQCYTGAVLVTSDGCWPSERESPRVASALEKCGIKDWELYRVDNSCCIDPPLSVPQGSRYHSQIELRAPQFSSRAI